MAAVQLYDRVARSLACVRSLTRRLHVLRAGAAAAFEMQSLRMFLLQLKRMIA